MGLGAKQTHTISRFTMLKERDIDREGSIAAPVNVNYSFYTSFVNLGRKTPESIIFDQSRMIQLNQCITAVTKNTHTLLANASKHGFEV